MGLVNVPENITSGTTFQMRAPAGVTLHLRGPSSIDLESDGKNITAPPHETAQWIQGFYLFSLRNTEKNGNISQISSGSLQVLQDITQITPGTDARSQIRRTYDAICAVIERRASLDQMEYRINNRELKRIPIDDLLKLRAHYASLLLQEGGRSGFREHRISF